MNPLHNPENYNLGTERRCGMGAILLLNLFDSLKCGICGPNPLPSRALTNAVQIIDPGYCIDAPEAMPAGGHGQFLAGPIRGRRPARVAARATSVRPAMKPARQTIASRIFASIVGLLLGLAAVHWMLQECVTC